MAESGARPFGLGPSLYADHLDARCGCTDDGPARTCDVGEATWRIDHPPPYVAHAIPCVARWIRDWWRKVTVA